MQCYTIIQRGQLLRVCYSTEQWVYGWWLSLSLDTQPNYKIAFGNARPIYTPATVHHKSIDYKQFANFHNRGISSKSLMASNAKEFGPWKIIIAENQSVV